MVGSFVIVTVYFVTFVTVVLDVTVLLCEFLHTIFVGPLLCCAEANTKMAESPQHNKPMLAQTSTLAFLTDRTPHHKKNNLEYYMGLSDDYDFFIY